MTEIIDIDSLEPHYAKEVICVKCLHRWIAVYNQKTPLKDLQCPNCQKQGYTIYTGQEYNEKGEAI